MPGWHRRHSSTGPSAPWRECARYSLSNWIDTVAPAPASPGGMTYEKEVAGVIPCRLLPAGSGDGRAANAHSLAVGAAPVAIYRVGKRRPTPHQERETGGYYDLEQVLAHRLNFPSRMWRSLLDHLSLRDVA
jgi:hypothetical protein